MTEATMHFYIRLLALLLFTFSFSNHLLAQNCKWKKNEFDSLRKSQIKVTEEFYLTTKSFPSFTCDLRQVDSVYYFDLFHTTGETKAFIEAESALIFKLSDGSTIELKTLNSDIGEPGSIANISRLHFKPVYKISKEQLLSLAKFGASSIVFYYHEGRIEKELTRKGSAVLKRSSACVLFY